MSKYQVVYQAIVEKEYTFEADNDDDAYDHATTVWDDQHIFDGLPVWHGNWDMPEGPQVIEE